VEEIGAKEQQVVVLMCNDVEGRTGGTRGRRAVATGGEAPYDAEAEQKRSHEKPPTPPEARRSRPS
jgi:hypothetical protein